MAEESKTDWSSPTFRRPETRTAFPTPRPPQGDPPPRAVAATQRTAAATPTATAAPWVLPDDIDFDSAEWAGVEDSVKKVLRALCRQTDSQNTTIESLQDQNSSLRNEIDTLNASNVDQQRTITTQRAAITNLVQRVAQLTGGAAGGVTTMQSGGLITDPDRFQRSPCARTAPFDLSSKTGYLLCEAAQEAISPAFDGKPVNLIS